tara:strand:- start:468 stop:1244 length:777 start_codon:yes stop_codon:yes gene_type:complete
MLTTTRADHGESKDGKFACYVRVSNDDQDVANQEHGITAWLNGGKQDVQWFREEGVSSGEDWHNRTVLQDCLKHCRKTGATMVIYSLSRMSRKQWEALRFFEQEVSSGKIKLVVVDDPTLDETTVGFKAMFAQHERQQIRSRTKLALDRIKNEIADKGSYVTKEGRTITSLGVHDGLAEAGQKGADVSKARADARAKDIWPIMSSLLEQGVSYRGIARELNRMKVAPPSRRRNPDIARPTEWHASSVRNYALRMKGTK